MVVPYTIEGTVMANDTQTHVAELHARHNARVLPPGVQAGPPSAALIADRMRANVEGQGQDVRASVSASTFATAQAISRALSNPTLGNDAQKILYVASLAKPKMADSLGLIDVRRDIVTRQQARVAAEVEAAYQPRNPVHAAQGPEIRSMLRAMPERDRDHLLHSLKGTPDWIPILYAVAGAPAALSGVSLGQQGEMRRLALAIRDPELLTLPDEIADELKLLDECEEGIRRTYAELVDFDTADALQQLSSDPARA